MKRYEFIRMNKSGGEFKEKEMKERMACLPKEAEKAKLMSAKRHTHNALIHPTGPAAQDPGKVGVR